MLHICAQRCVRTRSSVVPLCEGKSSSKDERAIEDPDKASYFTCMHRGVFRSSVTPPCKKKEGSISNEDK